MKLTEKQKRFCDYYIETGNAAESARRAGYSLKTADVMGMENLRKPKLKIYIDERLVKLESARIASADEVLQYLSKVMRQEAEEEVLQDGVRVFRAASIRDANKAAELLCKRYGITSENLNVKLEGKITQTHNLANLTLDELRALEKMAEKAADG